MFAKSCDLHILFLCLSVLAVRGHRVRGSERRKRRKRERGGRQGRI